VKNQKGAFFSNPPVRIIDYQELEIEGQSAQTKKGAKGAIKKFIAKAENDQNVSN
jgi:hypothetical protein